MKSRKLRVPKKLNPRRNTPRHIITTLPKIKDKERLLKTAREKETVTYKGVPIRLSADSSKENLQARRDWQEIYKIMKAGTYSQDFSTQKRYHLELKGR